MIVYGFILAHRRARPIRIFSLRPRPVRVIICSLTPFSFLAFFSCLCKKQHIFLQKLILGDSIKMELNFFVFFLNVDDGEKRLSYWLKERKWV
jgi:hypothetical protein